MALKDDPVRVGCTIRSLREAYGWSRLKFAEAVGVSRSHLSNIEDGRKACTPEMARKVADTLGVPLAAITTALHPAEISGNQPRGVSRAGPHTPTNGNGTRSSDQRFPGAAASSTPLPTKEEAERVSA